jgi:hypothetical protein
MSHVTYIFIWYCNGRFLCFHYCGFQASSHTYICLYGTVTAVSSGSTIPAFSRHVTYMFIWYCNGRILCFHYCGFQASRHTHICLYGTVTVVSSGSTIAGGYTDRKVKISLFLFFWKIIKWAKIVTILNFLRAFNNEVVHNCKISLEKT